MGRMWIAIALVAIVGCKQGARAVKALAEYERENRTLDEADRVSEEARARSQPHLAGPGVEPGPYRIVALEVEAEPRARHGRAWDAGGPPIELPDLRARIVVDGREVARCDGADDSLRARCELDVAIDVEPHSVVVIDVIDRDVIVDDPVGTATLADPSTWDVGRALLVPTTDRLRAASLELVARPTLAGEIAVRATGATLGIGLATAALVGVRRRRRDRGIALASPPPSLRPAGVRSRIQVREPITLAAMSVVLAELGVGVLARVSPRVAESIVHRASASALAGAAVALASAAVVRRRALEVQHVATIALAVVGCAVPWLAVPYFVLLLSACAWVFGRLR